MFFCLSLSLLSLLACLSFPETYIKKNKSQLVLQLHATIYSFAELFTFAVKVCQNGYTDIPSVSSFYN